MKMELTEGSETSAYINQTPGNYPKGNLLYYITYSCCQPAFSIEGFFFNLNKKK